MDEKEIKNNIPCIVDNGILYNAKDIQKVLRDLGHVSYYQLIDDEIKASGEGYIVSVVANNSSANIIVNKRLYLNVNGFEYIKINTENGKTSIDLVEPFLTLRIVPMSNPLSEEMNAGDIVLSHATEYTEEDYDETFAEINMDDDYEED
jgi:hypothetical protein